MLFIGFAIAALFGAGCIVLPKALDNGKNMTYLLAAALAAFYTLINCFVFVTTANRKYRKIEV